MHKNLNVIVLAAGKGTRMRSDRPKVLQPLAGRPLLAHVLDAARALEPAVLAVVYGYGGEQVPRAVAGEDLSFVLQAEQLGTGHACQQALPLLTGDTTLVLYGDVPLIRTETLARLLEGATTDLVLLTQVLADPAGYGRILRDGDGRITGIVEQKDADEVQRAVREINTGILALPTEQFRTWLNALTDDNAQREYYLTDIVGMAARAGHPIRSVAPAFDWETAGVNDKPQLASLERLYQALGAERLMEAGVTLLDPARIDVRGALSCGRDVEIDVNCVFEGQVNLGDRTRIGPNCVLRDVTLGPDTVVLPFSHLEGAKTAAGNRIGPFARIRPGTELAEDVHIGNFVEIKNGQVAAHSKINHLSYVGDATVGQRVNIGAGTITCNYDGANKYRTLIEDDVFIGSNSQLVAPVTVGRGATIGAGSTITKDVPPGELTLARSRQVTIHGWQRPRKPGK